MQAREATFGSGERERTEVDAVAAVRAADMEAEDLKELAGLARQLAPTDA